MGHQEGKHASVRLYLVFAGILTAITFLEWGAFKVDSLRVQAAFLVPLLLGLSLAKFVMVCGWYMHLRFDHPLLWKIFGASLLLTCVVFTMARLALH